MIYRTISLAFVLFVSLTWPYTEQLTAPATHTLKPTPKTVAWVYYDAKAAPVLRVKSDDTIETQTSSLSTQAKEQNQPIVYVKHLEPPLHYPPVARAARLHGAVAVKLTIAVDGTVVAIQSSSPDTQTVGYPLLRDETEKLLKKWTFGCANCPPNAPYEKTIKFVYRIENEGVSYDDTKVVMELPDEVTIAVSPPECDHCPPKKVIK